ncbi:hypothetical protein HK102_002495 [Quaeritorhiza haematococci]|nr:hypothetical protein HK102_002495 [Quaeritorhiza haematococci]
MPSPGENVVVRVDSQKSDTKESPIRTTPPQQQPNCPPFETEASDPNLESTPVIKDEPVNHHKNPYDGHGKLYAASRFLGYLTLPTIVFLAPAIVVYYFFFQSDDQQVWPPQTWTAQSSLNVKTEVIRWSLWVSFLWVVWITLWHFVFAVPGMIVKSFKVFIGVCPERVRGPLQHLKALCDDLVFVLHGIAMLATYPFWFWHKNFVSWEQVIWKVLIVVFVAEVTNFMHQAIIHRIAVRFHRAAWSERIKKVEKATKILDQLELATRREALIDKLGWSEQKPNLRAKSLSFDSTQRPNIPAHNSNNSKHPKKVQIRKNVSGVLNARDTRKVEESGHTRATGIAHVLFRSFQGNDARVTIDDFKALFETEDEATEAFQLFDADNNGDVTREEFELAVVEYYRDRQTLINALADMNSAVGKLAMVFRGVNVLVILVAVLIVAEVPITAVLPFTSLLLSFSFAFAGVAKTAFEALIFIFVTHPYDQGDRIIIDDQVLVVENFGVLTTIFRRADGQLLYSPNAVLANKNIINIRRSGDLSETIKIQVSSTTPQSLLDTLKDRLTTWIGEHTRAGFKENMGFTPLSIEDMHKLEISIGLNYKGNWQDMARRWELRNQFMWELRRVCEELGITYWLPPRANNAVGYAGATVRVSGNAEGESHGPILQGVGSGMMPAQAQGHFMGMGSYPRF